MSTIYYESPKKLSTKWIKENAGEHKFDKDKGKYEIVLKNSVTKIGKSAFIRCENLTSIEIPNGITEIGDMAFLLCENLTSVTIPSSVAEIGEFAFNSCKNLITVDIPRNVTEIKYASFSGCTSLESVDIKNSVTEIGKRAFYNCENLQSIEIPDSVKAGMIGDRAFSFCDKLPEGTKEKINAINKEAFDKTWGFVRETRVQAEKSEKYDDVHRTGLEEYLKVIFPGIKWINNESFVKGRQIRPDYRSESLNLIIEFDGLEHYTKPKRIIEDNENQRIYEEQEHYKVVRVPYFIQLTNKVVKQMLGVEVPQTLFPEEKPSFTRSCIEDKYPYSPTFLCPAGLKRMAEDFLKYPEQYETNLKALKELNNDELSGVKFLEEAYKKAKMEKSEKGLKND